MSVKSSEKTSLTEKDQGPYYFYKTNHSKAGDSEILRGGENEPLVVREQEPVVNSSSRSDFQWWPFRAKERVQPMNKIRKVPIKVEPKVFFSNERTFIAWMNMSVTLATIATAIIAFADQNPWSEIYGLILLPVAVCFILYALYQYMNRARLIRRRAPGPYEDEIGPIILACMLMFAIISNCAIKLYEMYY